MTEGTPPNGGSQTGGGSGASGASGSGAAGVRFNGGNVLACSYGGGGGGGYYGGGGGGYTGNSMGGGAGGSGYVNLAQVGWYATQRGWMNIPPTDSELPANTAIGGPEGLPGGHGYVLIKY